MNSHPKYGFVQVIILLVLSSLHLQSEVDIKSRKLEELSSRETIPEVDHASLKINTKPEIIVLTDS